MSRKVFDRTVESRFSVPVSKLAVSISTRTLDSPSGSATSTVPPRIAKVPSTEPSPNMCLVLNLMTELLVSMS